MEVAGKFELRKMGSRLKWESRKVRIPNYTGPGNFRSLVKLES